MFGNLKFFAGVAALALGASALGGCETARDPETLNSPYYAQGYSDGCQTGHSRVAGFSDTITKDRVLSESEPAYETGWRDGYNACGGDTATDETNRDIFETDSDHWDSVPR
jgi:hypothetical protein